ncbi:MAG: hypothetical protein OQK94_08990 [Gammaproteobacteria bacterium]|nr:hypothetical protein [Gammaproteobacteria bacterium]MCW8840053.1 hypothetical protein [Gammaproteobacteria bacterium]MCW8958127.1 hypothetical protein [Gammaproteobacteria bacterium]MCW8994168.1 hypothetical protein [Gammaproteobacteria bacterium]MCW9089225.1 hypothetical protein [Gammaproteobacteria bacterium]
MKKSILQEKYPIYSLELGKDETSLQGVDAIIDYLKQKVDENPITDFIAIFDHYTHTRSLEQGEISPDIVDAKNLVFCFGIKLNTPQVMAVRPRSIGVTETKTGYVINFLEAPMPIANETMERWVKSITEV